MNTQTTPSHSQAVEAAVQQIMELADTFCNASDNVVQMLGANAGMDEGNVYWVEMKQARAALEAALRAALTSQQKVAAPVSDDEVLDAIKVYNRYDAGEQEAAMHAALRNCLSARRAAAEIGKATASAGEGGAS